MTKQPFKVPEDASYADYIQKLVTDRLPSTQCQLGTSQGEEPAEGSTTYLGSPGEGAR